MSASIGAVAWQVRGVLWSAVTRADRPCVVAHPLFTFAFHICVCVRRWRRSDGTSRAIWLPLCRHPTQPQQQRAGQVRASVTCGWAEDGGRIGPPGGDDRMCRCLRLRVCVHMLALTGRLHH